MAQRQAKIFAEMLNHALDELDMPADVNKRCDLLAQLLGITRHKARVMLEGYSMPKPNDEVYQRLVDELGIESTWSEPGSRRADG